MRKESRPPEYGHSRRPWREYGKYGTVGIELVLSVLLGLWAGRAAGDRFSIEPWGSLIGILIGAYAGFRAIWKAALHMGRELEPPRSKGSTLDSDRAKPRRK